MKDIEDEKIQEHEYFSNPKTLAQTRQKLKDTQLFLATHGRRKIWKPEKFQVSRKVKIDGLWNNLMKRD